MGEAPLRLPLSRQKLTRYKHTRHTPTPDAIRSTRKIHFQSSRQRKLYPPCSSSASAAFSTVPLPHLPNTQFQLTVPPPSLDPLRQRNRNPFRRQVPRTKYVRPLHSSPSSQTLHTRQKLQKGQSFEITDTIRIVGWGNTTQDPGFGGAADNTSIKAKIVNLIASVRTLMRSTSNFSPPSRPYFLPPCFFRPMEVGRNGCVQGELC